MKDKNKANGFTLIELLIAMVIALLLMTAIYSTYRTQQKAYLVQDQVVGMQQNLRAAMNLIERDFRMMGYDPRRSANAGITVFTKDSDPDKADKGFKDSITYTIVADDDGIDNNDDGDTDESDELHRMRYRLCNPDAETDSAGNDIFDDLCRTVNMGTSFEEEQVVAENIQVFDLVGLDEDNAPTTVADEIRSIEITLVGRTLDTGADWQDKNYSNSTIFANSQGTIVLNAQNDNLRRMIVTTRIKCRNLGM